MNKREEPGQGEPGQGEPGQGEPGQQLEQSHDKHMESDRSQIDKCLLTKMILHNSRTYRFHTNVWIELLISNPSESLIQGSQHSGLATSRQVSTGFWKVVYVGEGVVCGTLPLSYIFSYIYYLF